MPPLSEARVASYWNRYPTPDELPPTQFWVDSPLEVKQSAPSRAGGATREPHHLDEPPAKASQTPLVRDQPPKTSSAKKQELRFFNVTDPKELKDRSQLRLNRQHVMHTFLDKERQKPAGQRVVRVDGAGAAMKRKRSRIKISRPLANALNGDVERGAPPTPAESSSASDREVERGQTASEETSTEQKKARRSTVSNSQELVRGLNGTWPNSRYNNADWENLPFNPAITTAAHPSTPVGSALNPFNTWPTFSTTDIDVNRLKWSCSRRFGSEGIARHWVPALLRAQHAFLSTICISAAHDDIMARAYSPQRTLEGIERLRVRSEVIGMVNASLDDPELRIADATIISVLHLLNSEIMGCDDRVMKTHQDGLHRMVRQRGGLGGLGVDGQLARILTM